MAAVSVITAEGGNEVAVARAVREHLVRFYDRDDELVAELCGGVLEAVTRGEAFVCIATQAHRDALESLVGARGVDLGATAYLGLDAAETLAQFMVGSHPHPSLFEQTIGRVLDTAGMGGRPVRAYGEMVALLWEQGDVEAAIELEGLWNELARTRAFSLLCGYPTTALDTAPLSHTNGACAAHSAVLPPESYATAPASLVPGSVVLVGVPEAVPAARRFLASCLPAGLRPEVRSDAELVVSELATNAVRHATSAFRLTVQAIDDGVRLTVQDADPLPPEQRSASPHDHGGRGISIVGSLASWGYDPLADGKVVWAELSLS